VVLGAGPVYVKMHKQCVELVTGKGDNMCLSSDRLRSTSGHSWLAYTVDEYHATLVAAHEQREGDTESNYYVYAELREPDGTIWTGFSGFGVGAGLETIPGFSTEARVKRLRWLFPDSFAAADAAAAAELAPAAADAAAAGPAAAAPAAAAPAAASPAAAH
jgi:hypothetical protein